MKILSRLEIRSYSKSLEEYLWDNKLELEEYCCYKNLDKLFGKTGVNITDQEIEEVYKICSESLIKPKSNYSMNFGVFAFPFWFNYSINLANQQCDISCKCSEQRIEGSKDFSKYAKQMDCAEKMFQISEKDVTKMIQTCIKEIKSFLLE